MSPRLNLTYPTALVLQALANGFHHGFDIMDATSLPSGTVYPILRRLDREGLLRSAWEKQATAQREQRPPRRYYDITPTGAGMLSQAVQRYQLLAAAVAPPRRLKPSRGDGTRAQDDAVRSAAVRSAHDRIGVRVAGSRGPCGLLRAGAARDADRPRRRTAH